MKSNYLILSAALSIIMAFPSHAAWINQNNSWFYQMEDQQIVKNSWRKIDNDWYFFDETGTMVTGWKQINNKWYFLNPMPDGTKGKMVTGWHWIDGWCYYFSTSELPQQPEGAMYSDQLTPDGYFVNESGAWTDAAGNVQYTAGKGILTKMNGVAGNKYSGNRGGSSGGGGGNGGSSGNLVEEDGGNGDDLDKVDGNEKEDIDKIDEDEKEDPVGIEEGENSNLENEVGNPGGSESIKPEATPSEATKVSWDIYFVEAENHSHQILKPQHGITEEGERLTVDFPERLIDPDGYYYQSLVPSPWNVIVNGTGTQKYYIEYEKDGQIKLPENPDQGVKAKLQEWLNLSRTADKAITGQEAADQQLISASLKESNQRLKNLVSMVSNTNRYEVYIIAKGYMPNSLIIGQTFPDVKNISELIVDRLEIEEVTYTILRIGFEKSYMSDRCEHDFEVTDYIAPKCMNQGHETLQCMKCDLEETVILPALNHKDTDHNGFCDICYAAVNEGEMPAIVHFDIGDVQARQIGDRIYLFRCIDDDYEDGMGNNQQSALFLCDTVIRSDIESTALKIKKMTFGSNNNYKYSNVRTWLNNSAMDQLFDGNISYTGITAAYKGQTTKGTYEQFDEDSLAACEKPFQMMEDKIFILSVEEAIKYRDYLWSFEGSTNNNPETQLSAYSRGYYLRTPQYAGSGSFQYGNGVYAIDLINGNIHTVNVNSTDIGIRPAFTVPQG